MLSLQLGDSAALEQLFQLSQTGAEQRTLALETFMQEVDSHMTFLAPLLKRLSEDNRQLKEKIATLESQQRQLGAVRLAEIGVLDTQYRHSFDELTALQTELDAAAQRDEENKRAFSETEGKAQELFHAIERYNAIPLNGAYGYLYIDLDFYLTTKWDLEKLLCEVHSLRTQSKRWQDNLDRSPRLAADLAAKARRCYVNVIKAQGNKDQAQEIQRFMAEPQPHFLPT